MLLKMDQPVLSDDLATKAKAETGVSFELPPCLRHSASDQMLDTRYPYSYLRAGAEAARIVQTAMSISKIKRPARILDLGCGHGRVMRWIRARHPDAEIVAADVVEDCVEFCAKTFSATPLHIPFDLTQFPSLDCAFDIVWSGSVITHLNEADARHYISLLLRLIRPGGISVFSSHGRAVAERMAQNTGYLMGQDQGPIVRGYRDIGYGWAPYADSPNYGVSVIKPSWLFAQVAVNSNARVVFYGEQAWDGHHDVMAVTHP